MNSVTLLESIATWLDDNGLAQYLEDGDYRETGLPAVVFADKDVPDTLLLLAVAEQKPNTMTAGGHLHLRFTWRASGPDSRDVNRFADELLDWLTDWRESAPRDRYNTPVPEPLPFGSLSLVKRDPSELADQARKTNVKRDRYKVDLTFSVPGYA